MKLSEKQTLERRYFELFIQHYALPTGAIEYDDKPDVIINGERKLGVEIVRLYKADGRGRQSEQAQSLGRVQVIELAERLYLSRGGRKIELWIDFDPQHPITCIKETAEGLALIASQVSSEIDGHRSYSAFEATPEVRFLYHDGKEHPESKWGSVQGHDVPALSVTRVKELVQQKIKRIRGYKPCDAYWLLLIVDFWDPAQDQDIHWPAGESVGPTLFERVLIFKPPFEQVVEVIQ